MTRVDVAIAPDGGGWQVAITCGGASLARFALAPLDDAAIEDTVAALRERTAKSAAVHALGERLYAAVLAPAWGAIAAAVAALPAGDAAAPRVIELALWLADAPALAGLPWELLRGPEGFLARGVTLAGAPADVVITRRHARARVDHPRLAAPLRYLFAIGTELGDPVRAGAECLGLLRQIGAEVCERIVERQSIETLRREVQAFDPHVVHVIAHGRDTVRGGVESVELVLWDEHSESAAVPVGPAALCDLLVRRTDGPRAPAVAILSACSSGKQLAGARFAGPARAELASALVAAGVPVVIGMAGEISDLACRLFTRRFGEATVERRPLLIAAAHGRAAALSAAQMPADSFEWGLIQLALGDDVDAAIAVAPAAADSDEARVLAWLRKSDLPLDLGGGPRAYPALCAATDVLGAFYQLVRSPDHAALALVTYPPAAEVRVGLSRACAEVVALAIRAGHVPVLVNHRPADGDPVSPRDVIERLIDGFKDARKWRQLAPVPLALASAPLDDPRALRDALEHDAEALRTDARAAHSLIARARGEVVIVFHDVHRYADGVRTALGLCKAGGGVDDRVLVVLGYAMRPPPPPPSRRRAHQRADEPWRVDNDSRFAEWLAAGRRWIAKVELRALDPRTARLAYQRVLLHPFTAEPPIAVPIAKQQLFLDLAHRGDKLGLALGYLDDGSAGRYPGQFESDEFYRWVKAAANLGEVLTVADDDQILASWRKP